MSTNNDTTMTPKSESPPVPFNPYNRPPTPFPFEHAPPPRVTPSPTLTHPVAPIFNLPPIPNEASFVTPSEPSISYSNGADWFEWFRDPIPIRFSSYNRSGTPTPSLYSVLAHNGDGDELSTALTDDDSPTTSTSRPSADEPSPSSLPNGNLGSGSQPAYKWQSYELFTDGNSPSPLSPAPSPVVQSRLWSLPAPNNTPTERYPQRITVPSDNGPVATTNNGHSTTPQASTAAAGAAHAPRRPSPLSRTQTEDEPIPQPDNAHANHTTPSANNARRNSDTAYLALIGELLRLTQDTSNRYSECLDRLYRQVVALHEQRIDNIRLRRRIAELQDRILWIIDTGRLQYPGVRGR